MGRLTGTNRIGGVIFSVLTSGAVYYGFDSWSGEVKETINLVLAASPGTHHQDVRAYTGWIGIMIMCSNGGTHACLQLDCCFSELVLYKSNTVL